jgi:simple sugar transport system permease protein
VSLAELLTISAPLILAATAELLGQRAGVLNIGIEGVMLTGCLAAALAAPVVGPWWAVLVAGIVAALVNLVFAVVVVTGGDQVVAGTGMVLVGMGGTGMLFRHLQTQGLSGALVPTLPWGVAELGAIAVVAAVAGLVHRSRLGLVLRASGENPAALAAAGYSPGRVRLIVLSVSGALIGIGGAVLVLRASGAFVEGMTAGRGFLALSLVMLGRWRPWLVAAASVLLGAAVALQFHLQGLGIGVSPYLLLALPYVLTLIVLAVIPRDRLGGPRALGEPYQGQR